MKFIVTVDTEADDQWKQDGSVTLHNLDALSRFQRFMEERGVPPTYLASHETLAHPALAALAQAHHEGKAELGGHLHPWTTPPYDALDATVQRFPLELPEEVLDQKMRTLTDALTQLLGEAPVSFRAGRWGADERVLAAIARHGYRVDSSVTPGVNWKMLVKNTAAHTKIPDFSRASATPYIVSGTNLTEVPMSVLATGVADLRLLTNPSFTLVRRAGNALARRRWCRIFPETTLEDLEAVYRAALRQRLPALVFMTHSSELAAGRSPYAKDEAVVDRTYALLDSFTERLLAQGVVPARLCDAAVGMGQ